MVITNPDQPIKYKVGVLKTYYVLFLFYFTLYFDVVAQSNKYHAFPDSNAVWRVDGNDCNMGGIYSSSYQYTIQGDTIIGLYSYHKIYLSGMVSQPCQPPIYSNSYFCGLRQDTISKKVYFARPGYSDTVLYDFNLHIGDTIHSLYCHWNRPSGYQNRLIINSIDSVLVGAFYHKRFNTNSPPSAIIEGVGGSFGLFDTIPQSV